MSRSSAGLTTLLGAALLVAVVWAYQPNGLSADWGDDTARRGAAAIVRAAFRGDPAPAGVRLPAGRPRVFVTAHGPGWTERATAQEAGIAQSLEAAARELGGKAAGRSPKWLVVDVVAGKKPFRREPTGDILERVYETGVDGILAESNGVLGATLPADPITEGWFSPRKMDPKGGGSRWYTRGDEGIVARDTARTRLALALRAKPDPAAVTWTRFRTASFLFRTEGKDDPVELFRGMPVGPLSPEPAKIREASIAGGEWLVAQVDSAGMFQYTYVPNRDEDTPPGSYSYIRHTATAWMMVRLGRRFDQPRWVEAAVRALRWSEAQIVPAPTVHAGRAERGARRAIVAAPREAKGGLGHNAVTIIALAEIVDQLTPEQIAKLKLLGVSLEMMLRCESRTDTDPCVGGDGGFFESEAENLNRPKDKKDMLLYEPGEGVLALVTLAELFPEEKHWLESARVAAGYHSRKFLTARPNAWWEPRMVARAKFADRVHWTTMALEKLAKLTGEKEWAQTAVEMGEAVLSTGSPPIEVAVTVTGRTIGPASWDYSGSFPLPGRVPRTTPTGSRAEALNAARRCALLIGKDPTPFESMLRRTAGFQLRNQFTETSCYFCPKPEKALGAFRAGLTDNEIRIDFIQHVIAGQADTLEWLEPEFAAKGGS